MALCKILRLRRFSVQHNDALPTKHGAKNHDTGVGGKVSCGTTLRLWHD
jgi:hypothetical protein